MRLSFYSSEATDPFTPIWTEKEEINTNDFKFSDLKFLILGKLHSSSYGLDSGRPSGAIILKSVAIFETIKNAEKSDKISKLFIDRYFELENKK